MKLLLDTHVWIWSQEELDNLGPSTFALLKDIKNDIFLSPVSTLEIARLIQLKQIIIKKPLKTWVNTSINNLLAKTIEISHDIAIKAYTLEEPFHKDPVDRLLAATALLQELTLITADEQILVYPNLHSHNALK
jgi:PIN domain nuclease of toxin-antitoxin system